MGRIKKLLTNPFLLFYYGYRVLEKLLLRLPYFRFIKGTRQIDPKNTLKIWFVQKVLGYNRNAYWPMHHSSIVTYPQNALIGVDTNPGYNPGCFVHGVNKIYVGDYTKIAPNVGLMSGNHDLHDLREQTVAPPIRIGRYCWIGMNAVILQGVELGDYTVVAAGAVVNKSFPEGNCIIGGVPARKLKDLDPEMGKRYETPVDYIGYIKKEDFDAYRKGHLNV